MLVPAYKPVWNVLLFLHSMMVEKMSSLMVISCALAQMAEYIAKLCEVMCQNKTSAHPDTWKAACRQCYFRLNTTKRAFRH